MLDELEHRRLRSELAGLRVELALLRSGLVERKYSPDQPRVPAGTPEGGRWTDGENGAAAFDDALSGAPATLDDGVWRPATDDAALVPVAAAAKPPPRVDIRSEDSQGGHTVERAHVGASNAVLMKALEAEHLDFPDYSLYYKAHGSYDGLGSANAYTNDVLQMYPDRVEAVASGAHREDFLEKRYSSPTGREAYRMTETANSAIGFRPTFSAGVLIKHTGTGKGFVVITSYPKNQERAR